MKEGYKKTELGLIPEEWEVKTLETIVELIDGDRSSNYPSPNELVEDGVLFLSTSNIRNSKLEYDTCKFITQEKFDSLKKGKLQKNDLVITLRGSIGNVAKFTTDKYDTGFINAQMMILRGKKINSEYLLNVLISDKSKAKIKIISSGSAQPQLTKRDLSLFKVIVPPIREQEKIADILSTVDSQIDDTDKLIEKTKELKKGLMQRLLTKGIGHKEFKKTEIGEIPVEWEVKCISEVTDLTNGKAFKPSDWKEEGIPIIRIQNLNGSNEFNYYDRKIDDRYVVNKGQLLFSWSGSRGTSFGPHIWNGINGVLNQHIFKVDIKENKLIDKSFIYYNLRSITDKIEKEAHGSAGLVHITKGTLEKIKISIPQIEEQEKIANILSSVDNEIEEYENKKSKLEELKKGLMQQLLTGKTRVI